MTTYLFDPPAIPAIPVTGQGALYPVRRIFCVGRNYAAHAAEMGNAVDREAPFYFTKSPHALLASGATLPYPPGTQDLHHEMELALALGQPVFQATRDAARAAIFGYACALDMTRRDLQGAAKDKRRPWDLGKDFEGSAVVAPLTRAGEIGEIGAQRIHLSVNGETRQDAVLGEMIHGVDAIVADLSRFYHLAPGDLILTGTPAGVGGVGPGDVLHGGIDGLAPISLTMGPGGRGPVMAWRHGASHIPRAMLAATGKHRLETLNLHQLFDKRRSSPCGRRKAHLAIACHGKTVAKTRKLSYRTVGRFI